MAKEGKRDRVHLSYEIVGSQDTTANGEKPPIICLHGITSCKEVWHNVIRPIAEATHRKVYTYDARNHGNSGWSDIFDYEIMAEDLQQFMDCIHSQRAILLGHSMGGKTAMVFATKWPDRVEKLIIEDMSPKSAPMQLRDMTIKYVHMLHDALENIPPDTKDLLEAKNFVYQFMHKKTSEDANNVSSLPLCQDESGQFKWKTNLKVIEDFLVTVRKSNAVTGVFPGPALFLYGTKSPYTVSSDRDLIKRMFPDSELRAIEGASHQVHEERGDVFVKEVADFINES